MSTAEWESQVSDIYSPAVASHSDPRATALSAATTTSWTNRSSRAAGQHGCLATEELLMSVNVGAQYSLVLGA